MRFYYGLDAADHQPKFNTLIAEGYRLISLDVYAGLRHTQPSGSRGLDLLVKAFTMSMHHAILHAKNGVHQVRIVVGRDGIMHLKRAYTWVKPSRSTTQIDTPFLLASICKAFREAAVQSLFRTS
ncbi:hypothetical protein K432DRAFT_423351 [Lepidopterella palustris CBS 459.81]|uniref:Uncharacterized protein n=1 Tax=Lepidopterella palustris CBS 459.81 TaxID=1314670 RepID=A0A8E2EG95_9PEZI|nr:hypothetical protein K432DRAFT_423351 [Lepidopterella palustris CBS 459.81]